MTADVIGTELSGYVRPSPTGGSEGELAMRFEVAGQVAGTVRIVWNPYARIKTQEQATALLKQVAQHVGYVLQHRNPQPDDPSPVEGALRYELAKAKSRIAELEGGQQ